LNEFIQTLEQVNPILVWGANNENFEALKKQFPKLKIVARGTEVKVLGDETELHLFQAKFSEILKHIEQ